MSIGVMAVRARRALVGVARSALVAMASLVLGGASLLAVLAVGTAVPGPSAAAAVAHSISVVGQTSLAFGEVTLGDYTPLPFTVINNGASSVHITGYGTAGSDPNDFGAYPGADCPTDPTSGDIVLPGGASCSIVAAFFPGALGPRSATLTLFVDHAPTAASVTLSGTGAIGYYQVSSNGAVVPFGDAAYYGDASQTPLNRPIVGVAQTGDDGGYWLVATDGGIFTFGDAGFFGSAGGLSLNQPIVGMASTADGQGYWLVASDGGIFDYGDAPFYGSAGSLPLNRPIVGMAATPDGGGYWLVASDGGIFSYGDAAFYGSTGGIHLNKPIVGMAATPDGRGYWLVASDGGIFSFGDAPFYGSTGSIQLAQPINGMAAMPTGHGYWFTASDGGLFTYGDAPFLGAAAGHDLGGPVVAMATDGEPTAQAYSDAPALRAVHARGLGWTSLTTVPRQVRH